MPKPGILGTLWLRTQRHALVYLQSLAKRLGRGPHLPAHLAVGERGELEALFHLRQLGYTVVARRWRSPELRGDLDLVAWHDHTLCFVEVKTRSTHDPLNPAQSAVDDTKQQQLRHMARAYLRLLPRAQRHAVLTRFDLVAVYLAASTPQFELFRDAFGWR